jgi:lipoprotein signal peptidase
MPMARNRGAAWGAMSSTEPMMVSLVILTAMKIASYLQIFCYYSLFHGKLQGGKQILFD